MKSKSFLEIIILSVIAENDTYGYQLSKKINQINAEYLKLGEGTLYPCLSRLENKGYLSSYMALTEGRERKYYSITTAGKAYLANKIKEREGENNIISLLTRSFKEYGYE